MAGWLPLAYAVVVGLLGEMLELPRWARDISPLEHVPGMPAAVFEALPLAVLGVLAAALFALGMVGLGHRDDG
ncbi:MAG: hypothetical protein ACK5O2_14410 [Microthrixaceae bacterium]